MAWNGGELSYIVQLLESRGNKDVPRDHIVSYLRTQAAGATADKEFLIAAKLTEVSDYWQAKRYSDAVRIMRDAWAKEQNL